MNKITISAIIISAALTACAKHPDQIKAVNLPEATFATMSCASIASERARVNSKLTTLEAAQMDAVAGDALGVLLLGIPTSSLVGADQSTEIALEKGKLAALDVRQRDCR